MSVNNNNNTIRIAVNGVVHHLDAHNLLSKRPYLKLSEYLREDLHLTGTKVACGEGGCGGCTVLITRMESGGLTTVSCNACLAPLTSLHNAAITTVEGIYDASSPSTQQQQDGTTPTSTNGADGDYKMYDNLTVPSGIYEPVTTANAGPDAALSTRVEGRRPHPIQQRFASYNASQCGFCTPGFVMAVCGFLCKQGGGQPTTTTTPSPSFQLADIEDALDGNLCRCTGYRPILEAAAGTAITECHGDRKPDAACAKCVSCPRAQQCLPDGAHENTLEEARGVLKLVEGSFPFLEATPSSQTHTKQATTTLLPPKMPVAPHTVAARSNTITAAIQGGKPASALLDAIPVTLGTTTTSANPPAAFGYHTFPKTVEELVTALQAIDTPESVSLVAAQTSAGVYPGHLPVKISKAAVIAATTTTTTAPSVISLQYVDELCRVEPWVSGGGEEGITVGATTTISQLVGHMLYHALWLHSTGTNDDAKMNILRAATIIKTIAGTHVRDVATIGGNLNMCRNLGFASDLATPLCALNAVATVVDVTHGAGGVSVRRVEPLVAFLASTPNPKTTTVLISVSIPLVNVFGDNSAHTSTYFHRVATRSANAHAILNAACTIHHNAATITGVDVVLGNAGVMDVPHSNAPKTLPTDQLTSLLVGRPLSIDTIDSFKGSFHVPSGLVEGDYKVAARVMLVKAFIVASLEEAANTSTTSSNNKSYSQLYPIDQGHVYNPTTTKQSEPAMVVGRPISKPDGILHATGTTTYITDISPPKGTLYMSIVMSTVPSGIVKKFGTDALIPLQAINNNNGADNGGEDVPHQPANTMVANAEEPTTALILPDQKRHKFPLFIGAADLPQWALNRHPDIGGHLGEQDRKGAFPGGYYDFPLVANRLIAYCDQPIGVVIGRTLKEAELGAKAVSAATTYEDAVPSNSPTFPSHLPKVPSILGGRYQGLPIAAIRNHSIKMPEATTDGEDIAGDTTTTAVDFETVLLGQKHFYMENQACLVIPADGATRTKVHLAVHGVQHAGEFVAKAAGYAMNQVEIVQHRMGGSFGGKTNVVHACLAAILSRMYHRPVMVALDRITDTRFQGGREEMQIRSKVVTTTTASSPNSKGEFHHTDFNTLHASGTAFQTIPRIMSVDTITHADVGARVGFSNYTLGAVMPYSIMRCYSPSLSVNNTAIGYLTQSCERTNVRSPGHAEAAIITEAIIDRVAATHNVHSQVVREANFLSSDAALIKPYSKSMYTFPGLYKKMMAVGATSTNGKEDGWASRINSTIDFNKQHVGGRYKKGAAVVPFEYPVGGGQYSAMVVVLPDGSVAVHHSGVEMGQGLVIKSLQAANQELSRVLHQLCEGASDEHGNPKQMSTLPMSLFQSAGNSSHVLPKHGITGGSTSSEGSVDAVVEAAKKIADMLEPFVCMLFGSEVDAPEDDDIVSTTATAEDDVLGEYASLAHTTGASNNNSTKRQLQLLRSQLRRGEFETHTLWARLVALANSMGAHLTATAMNGEDSGSSDYSIYCVGGAEVTVDTYTGAVVVDRVDIMYDAGRSLNPAVDIGQIEGAFIMGLGYVLTEENAHHDTTTGGEVSGGSTWNYKVPSIRELPTQFNVQLMSPGDLDRWLLVNRDVVAASKEDGVKKEDEEVTTQATTASKSNGGKGLVMSSKATGEPPLCIAPCLLSAVRQAVMSSRVDKDLGGYPAISVPYTPDKVVRACGAM